MIELSGKKIQIRTLQPADYPAMMEILNDKETAAALASFFQVDHWTWEMIEKRYENFETKKQGLEAVRSESLLRYKIAKKNWPNLKAKISRSN
jgi:hypothetical protein